MARQAPALPARAVRSGRVADPVSSAIVGVGRGSVFRRVDPGAQAVERRPQTGRPASDIRIRRDQRVEDFREGPA